MAPLVKPIDLHNTSTAYYAPATEARDGRCIHISGQPGSTVDGTVPPDYVSQIHLALLNLRRVLVATGATVEHIAKLAIYIVNYNASDLKHTRHIQRFLGRHRPAITLVPVSQLAVPSWLFEIDAVLFVPPSPVQLMLSPADEAVDVVIIGAGLAGLTAAHEVLRRGYSCVVFEARDRVGGKTWSKPLKDDRGTVDLGAAWINDTNQEKMYALAKRYGAELIEQNTQGNCVIQDSDGKCSSFLYGDLPHVRSSRMPSHESLFAYTLLVRRVHSPTSCRNSRHG
jgi:monoamine oxidase